MKICRSQELIEMVKSGDIEALDTITRCFGERLLSVGRQYCRNEEEAQDAVQDALLSAGRNLTTFRGDGSVEGWLARMVANACFRMRRGRKNDPSLHMQDVEVPHQDSPEDGAARGQVAEALDRALMSLAPKDRVILMLAEGEGWTGPEIAERMGMTAGAVRTRLTRIRARLRSDLEGIR